jgi:hypothetical protein
VEIKSIRKTKRPINKETSRYAPKFRSKISLLFVVFAGMLAFPAIALADDAISMPPSTQPQRASLLRQALRMTQPQFSSSREMAT